MPNYSVLALNLGSTSSKVAYFENNELITRDTITHDSDQLVKFKDFFDQQQYRLETIKDFLKTNNIDRNEIDAIVCWGGHCSIKEGGIYHINDKMLEEIKSCKYGHHPCDLGPFIVKELSNDHCLSLSIDPPTIDEFSSVARYCGIKEIQRKSRMQTLNQKAVAKYHAKSVGKDYEQLNLIVCNLGGGFSIVVHQKGKMVDANNGLDGDGPFSSNRAGTIPAGDLVDLCFSNKYSKEEVKSLLTGKGGLVSLLENGDTISIEKEINNGNKHYQEVYEAMIYNIAKQIGASATVLKGDVDAIIVTGGLANSKYVISHLREYVGFISEMYVYPGELEMLSLGESGYRALIGKEKIKEI